MGIDKERMLNLEQVGASLRATERDFNVEFRHEPENDRFVAQINHLSNLNRGRLERQIRDILDGEHVKAAFGNAAKNITLSKVGNQFGETGLRLMLVVPQKHSSKLAAYLKAARENMKNE